MSENPRIRIYANRWFAKFAAKEKISDASLADAVHRAESGLIDADLGSGLIKQRIARQGGGKSGGYRSILIYLSGERAIFVFAFAKSGKANLNAAELKEIPSCQARIACDDHACRYDVRIPAASLAGCPRTN